MRPTHRDSVASNLRAEIARKRLRQADLTNIWGLSEMAVSRRMTGRTPITADQLVAAAEWLGIQPSDLLTERAS